MRLYKCELGRYAKHDWLNEAGENALWEIKGKRIVYVLGEVIGFREEYGLLMAS